MATKQERQSELERILKRDGEVKPSVLVKEAKAKRNALHDEFEWDDKKAAHEQRLATARRLIRVTPIAPEGYATRLVHVPPVVVEQPTAVSNEREGAYKPMQIIAKSPDEYERALRELMTQLRTLERSIAELKRAAGEEVLMLPTLVDAMQVAKDTVKLMLDQHAA